MTRRIRPDRPAGTAGGPVPAAFVALSAIPPRVSARARLAGVAS
jgi:hypothetical protein